MKKENFTFKEKTGLDVFVYKWLPEDNRQVKGILQIAHGMAETAARYERVAEKLTEEGYIVYANDHRGHGKTAKDIEKLGNLGIDGFNNMVENMHQLTEIIKKENEGLPLFLFGHSMGSFLLQRYVCVYSTEINGAIFSGSCGRQGRELDLGRWIAKREANSIGRETRSKKLNNLSFGGYNKAFKPNRTDFDWLSSDEKEVDKYIEDPYCGEVFTAGFFYDFLNGLKLIQDNREINKIDKKLPIYIFAGDKDPVGKQGKGILRLVKTYESLGIKDLKYKLYKDGRHEMLNEVNREEVAKDIIDWLNSHAN